MSGPPDLQVLGELPKGQSTSEGGQRGVDEEVLSSFFLEVLPAVWSGHSTDEGECCARGSEPLGEHPHRSRDADRAGPQLGCEPLL